MHADNMHAILTVLFLSFIILISKTAGILAVVLLSIIVHNTSTHNSADSLLNGVNPASGSSMEIDTNKKAAHKDAKISNQVC